MDTLADVAMPPPPDPAGRSFALLAQDERDRLTKLLRPLPWIDGLITAMVIAPASPDETDGDDEALDWLYLIWKEGSEAEIGKLTLPQSAEIVDPVMAHYVHIAELLCDEPEAYRPYLAGYSDPMEAASQWAAGFWGGLSINPDVWTSTLEDEDALPLLVAVLSLVRDAEMPEAVRNDADSPFRNMPPDRREHMRRSALDMLPEIVLALHDYSLGLDEAGAQE
jgi:yecA family protein